MSPPATPPEPSPSSNPSSTPSSASPSEASDPAPSALLLRLAEAVERLDSKFDELILAVKLLVGSHH